jgi:hypothetical protein
VKPWIPRASLEASDSHLARAVFLLLLAVYTATFSGPPSGPDGEIVFQTTSSIWRRASLALGGTPEAEGLIAAAEEAAPGGFPVRRGEGSAAERHYGWYGVGQALGALPLYAAGKLAAQLAPDIQAAHESHLRYGVARSEYCEHLFVGWRNPLLSALTAMLLVLAARRLGLSRWTAFLCGVGYGLATFAWPQARDSLGDVQGAFFLAAGLYLFLRLHERLTTRNAGLFGLSLAMACLTRAALLPAVIVLDAFLLWLLRELRDPLHAPLERARERSVLLYAALPQVAAALLWLLLNQLRFGSPFDSGYGPAIAGGLFGGDPLRALLGLTLSPSKGLLWMAPGLLLLGRGLLRAREEKQTSLVLVVAAVSLAVALPVLFLRGWHGAYTFGPRYLLPALPLLWLVAALGFQRSDVDPRVHPLALGLLVFGLVTQVPGALVDTLTYHDLAVRAAGERFEVAGEGAGTQADREADAFEALQFDWGFGAPWVHWRILRHRVAKGDEVFQAADLFRWPTQLELTPVQPREQGFGHLAWVDLHQRLNGWIWPAVALLGLLGALGTIEAVRGLDP